MKRKGFTLAEVLITLGVIGVVAALTLPNLSADVQGAKIGPKLGKAASMFEQANEALLNAEGVDSITDAGYASVAAHRAALTSHIKAVDTGGMLRTKDGVDYSWTFDANINDNGVPHNVKIGNVTIDINSANNLSIPATDVFYFALFNDGSLRPQGSYAWNGAANATTWPSKCPRAENGAVTDAAFCAGHIFENNMKVLYK